MKSKVKLHFSPQVRKRLLIASAVLGGVFILLNATLWATYRDRTYPNTTVIGTSMGNVAYRDLAKKINDGALLPEKVTFRYEQQAADISLQALGIRKDVQRTTASADKQRAWLPIVNIFRSPKLQAPVSVDSAQLQKQSDKLAQVFHRDAVNASLAIQNGRVSILPSQKGYVVRQTALQSYILHALDGGKRAVTISTDTVSAQIHAKALEPQQAELQGQLNTALTYTYAGKTKRPSAADIGNWYVTSGGGYAIATDKILAYLNQIGVQWGIRVKNTGQMAEATRQALTKRQSQTITVERQIAIKTFTYCTSAKGVDTAQLTGLRSTLHSVFSNSRGWSLDGLIEFKEVPSGCNFTVWLSAASLMPTFGAICDSMWSCRAGPNVVINFDRWQNASPAWNASKGTLIEYRHMVINHETGHWLGFGHSNCAGAGQPAPVMQQQSIDLQGCVFNAWPTPGELATFRQKQGI